MSDSNFCPFANIAVPPTGVEDEHPPVSMPLRNNSDFFLDEAPEMRKPDLHPLIDDLADRNQVLRDCWNVYLRG